MGLHVFIYSQAIFLCIFSELHLARIERTARFLGRTYEALHDEQSLAMSARPLPISFKNFYNSAMGVESRKSKRFDDIGRIDAPELCPLAGVLDNISRGGCKVHYTFPVAVDLENDYDLTIVFARAASESIELLAHPQWVKRNGGTTEIGFKILPSKGIARLFAYIKELDMDEAFGVSDQITNSGCQLI